MLDTIVRFGYMHLMSDSLRKFGLAFSAFVIPVAFAALSPACQGGGGGPSECKKCNDTFKDPYGCVIGSQQLSFGNDLSYVCASSQNDADTACQMRHNDVSGVSATRDDCYLGAEENADDETGAPLEWPTGWPGSEITYASGVYYVTDDLRDALHDDVQYLFADSARFEPATGGYFQLASVASGDLWEELGFANGDIFLTLNGNDLETASDVFDAYEDVWQDTTLVIVYKRGGTNYTRTIVIQ